MFLLTSCSVNTGSLTNESKQRPCPLNPWHGIAEMTNQQWADKGLVTSSLGVCSGVQCWTMVMVYTFPPGQSQDTYGSTTSRIIFWLLINRLSRVSSSRLQQIISLAFKTNSKAGRRNPASSCLSSSAVKVTMVRVWGIAWKLDKSQASMGQPQSGLLRSPHSGLITRERSEISFHTTVILLPDSDQVTALRKTLTITIVLGVRQSSHKKSAQLTNTPTTLSSSHLLSTLATWSFLLFPHLPWLYPLPEMFFHYLFIANSQLL